MPTHVFVQNWFTKLKNFWAARALVAGAVAMLFDLTLGLSLLHFGFSSRVSAMAGAIVGTSLTFLFNRFFAFKEENPTLGIPALKFLGVTIVSILIHGQLVKWLRDGLEVPFVPAKMISDLFAFSIFQLLLTRYFVFSSWKSKPPT